MDKKEFRWVLLLMPATGVLLAFLYSLTAWNPATTSPWKHVAHASGIFLLISGASFMGAAMVGFLFGFPRTSGGNDTQGQPIPGHNRSIEQISDWLTKMLIGIGLSQMSDMTTAVWSYGEVLTTGITTIGLHEGATAVAVCLTVYFAVCGIISGYFVTRLSLPSMLLEADQTAVGANGQAHPAPVS